MIVIFLVLASSCRSWGVDETKLGDVVNTVKALKGDLKHPLGSFGSSAMDIVNSIVGDEGTVTVKGRAIRYRFWGGLRGFKGWHWYGEVTDLQTGMKATSGGPDKRCRSRQCTVEDGVSNLLKLLGKGDEL